MNTVVDNDAIKYSFYCLFDVNSPLNKVNVTWAISLMHGVARWNRNSEWDRQIIAITDRSDQALQFLTTNQYTHYMRNTAAFTELGVTWLREANFDDARVTNASVWINPSQNEEQHIYTLAHELAHVTARTAHGWTWRRMCVMLTPMIMAYVTEDSVCLTKNSMREIASYVVFSHRQATPERGGEHKTNSEKFDDEINAHTEAAWRTFVKFESWLYH